MEILRERYAKGEISKKELSGYSTIIRPLMEG